MKTSASDMKKRLQIFNEFIYYLVDSILIPLIRTNFHVTESSSHKSRLFYFRHDVWRSLAEPAVGSLKLAMFEEMVPEKAQQILNARPFGFSHIRLLPKGTGVRPIMNLKRRAMKKGYKNVLGPSINSTLTPVFNMLTFEKVCSCIINLLIRCC
jgi:telomerase reverse transcriptase